MQPSFSLVVPVYNEEERFAEHAAELIGFVEGLPTGSELIVVDDGSADRTVDVVRACLEPAHERIKCHLLTQPHLGKGAAVRTGLAAAAADYAGFCDVDLATPLDDVRRVLEVAESSGGLAIASRGASGAELLQRQSRVRESMGRLYNRLLRWTVIDRILDTQCGAKVASQARWHELLAHSAEDGMAWDVEIVAVAQRVGTPVVEVPVRWSHDERSRVSTWSDGAKLVLALPRIARRLRDLSSPREVFEVGQHETLLEPHWWFRSKAAFVAEMLDQFALGQPGTLVDLGAGSGVVTAAVRDRVSDAVAVEGAETLARHARSQGLDTIVGSIEDAPVRDSSAGVVTLLDVLEHLDDPSAALREARRIVRPDGYIVVTVPAHRWLWSETDGFLGHRRRYTRRMLLGDLRAGRLDPCRVSHVFSWLTMPVWVRRRLPRPVDEKLGLSTRSPAIERAARVLTAIEKRLVRYASVPFGTSLIAVARVLD